MKTEAAERYVPVPEELKIRLLSQMGNLKDEVIKRAAVNLNSVFGRETDEE